MGSLGTMPNLRSLRLNIDGKVPDFNLASRLSANPALETLSLRIIGDGLKGGKHKVEVPGSGTALRHELQDALPKRLRNIIIEGKNIENIHPAAFKVSIFFRKNRFSTLRNDQNSSIFFQHLRSRTLSLQIRGSSEVVLDRDLFLNLGRVQNLSLDVSGYLPNPSRPVIVEKTAEELGSGEEPSKQVIRPRAEALTDKSPRELGNPVTSYSPERPRAVFLQHLDISNAAWECSCEGVG